LSLLVFLLLAGLAPPAGPLSAQEAPDAPAAELGADDSPDLLPLPGASAGGDKADPDAPYAPPEGESFVEFCGNSAPGEIKRAVEAGADVNFQTESNFTPLLAAAGFNPDKAAVEVLLEAGADLNHVERRFGLNALMVAASYNRDPAMIELLVDKGLDVNAVNFQGGTALIQAASSNPAPEVAEALVKAGADIDAADSMGATALMHASGYGSVRVIRKLVALKADVALTDRLGDTALAWAARTNPDSGAVAELLKAGADPAARNLRQYTPMYYSATNPNYDVFAFMLQTGAGRDNLVTPEGTALMLAAATNPNLSVARKLLAMGFDPSERNQDGITVLMFAVNNEEPAMTKLILAQRADPNVPDPGGRTALMYAANFSKNPVTVRLLLGAGADTDLVDNGGKTAADYARENTVKSVAALFENFKKSDGAAPAAPGDSDAAAPGAPPAGSDADAGGTAQN
jgi:ankyrin repeat protein